jgi:hypothetical protein
MGCFAVAKVLKNRQKKVLQVAFGQLILPSVTTIRCILASVQLQIPVS